MGGDLLAQLLRRVRIEVSGVPEDRWRAIEEALRAEYGGEEHYVGRRAKASLMAKLDAAAAAEGDLSAARAAQMLHVSVRHARRLIRMRGR